MSKRSRSRHVASRGREELRAAGDRSEKREEATRRELARVTNEVCARLPSGNEIQGVNTDTGCVVCVCRQSFVKECCRFGRERERGGRAILWAGRRSRGRPPAPHRRGQQPRIATGDAPGPASLSHRRRQPSLPPPPPPVAGARRPPLFSGSSSLTLPPAGASGGGPGCCC